MKTAFWKGFEKTAISMEQLRKVTSKVKNHIRAHNMMIPDAVAEFMSKGDPMKKKVVDSFSLSRISNRVHHDTMNLGPTYSLAKKKIFAKGDVVNNPNFRPLVDSIHGKMNGTQREFINRLLLAHEIDESKHINKINKKIKNGMTNRQFHEQTFNTHANPGIILREGNLLATAPHDVAEPARKIFSQFRKLDATDAAIKQVMPSYEHGKTRLSRHAIKHISNSIMEKRPALYRQAFGD